MNPLKQTSFCVRVGCPVSVGCWTGEPSGQLAGLHPLGWIWNDVLHRCNIAGSIQDSVTLSYLKMAYDRVSIFGGTVWHGVDL